MGWNPEEGYYQKFVGKEDGYSNKISEEQRKFNKLQLEEIRDGIKIAQEQAAKDRGETIQEVKKTTEPIEYVVEDDELDR